MDELLNKYRVRSTAITAIATWMMIWVTQWSMDFAAASARSGLEVTAILAAAQGTVTLYAGYAFRLLQGNKSI